MLLLLKAVQLLVVLAYRRGLLAQLGALQTGGRLVLVGLAERVWGEPLVERQFAGIQRDALKGYCYVLISRPTGHQPITPMKSCHCCSS